MTFSSPFDYDKIDEDDRLSIKGLKDFSPGEELELEVVKSDGSQSKNVALKHSYNVEQIKWFKAGSALNFIRSENKVL